MDEEGLTGRTKEKVSISFPQTACFDLYLLHVSGIPAAS